MFNKIQLTVFTLLVFVRCVVIFPIYCDFILLNILASIFLMVRPQDRTLCALPNHCILKITEKLLFNN